VKTTWNGAAPSCALTVVEIAGGVARAAAGLNARTSATTIAVRTIEV
jgi:hypothetical protein